MAGQSLLQHSDKISLSLSFGKTPPSLGPVASHRRLQIFAQLARRPLIYSVKNWSRDLREKKINMLSFNPPPVYQTSKCFVTHGVMGHLDPNQIPFMSKPWTTLRSQDFVHRVRTLLFCA